jgi:hypothetical protein
MTKTALITDVRNELTWSGALPYTMPDAEISREIDIATRYFYDNWRHSIESRYLLLPREIFHTQQFFEHNRTITLPDCVAFVHDVKETNGAGSIFGTIDPDFGDNKFIGSEIFLTPFIGESLMYRTIMLSFLDLTKAFTLDTVAFTFNKNTKRLNIIGHTPKVDIVVQTMVKIPEEDLYNDEIFQRYVRARAKLRFVQFLTAFGFQLPGGVTINFTLLSQNANDEWTAVQTQMASENTPDFMFFAHW